MKEFAKGKLGAIAQAALVTTVTVAGSALLKLNLSQGGSGPFLLALANRVSALSPDARARATKLFANFNELELQLAIATLRESRKRLDVSIAQYEEAYETFTHLVTGLQIDPEKFHESFMGFSTEYRNDRWRLTRVVHPLSLAFVLNESFSHIVEVKNVASRDGLKPTYVDIEVPRKRASRFKDILEFADSSMADLLSREIVPGR